MSDSRLYLSIAQPCHEDWAHMTPTERGRFCQACRKEVLDFTDLTPAAILHIVGQAPEGSLCGRIPAQVLLESRQQALAATRRSPARWLSAARQWLAAATLPLLAHTPLLARPIAEPPAATVFPQPRSRPTSLQVRIYDAATGQGVGFAAVQLWVADTLLLTAHAEADGILHLALPPQHTAPLRLLVQVPGYRIAEAPLQAQSSPVLAIPLQRGATKLPTVVREGESRQERRVVMGGAISTIVAQEDKSPRRTPRVPRKWLFWLRAAKPEQQ